MRTILITALAMAVAAPAAAQDRADGTTVSRSTTSTTIGTSRRFGLGVSVGDPTAISGKLYLQRAHAIDMALALGPGDDVDVYAHAVYLVHPSTLASEPGFDLGWHVGVGGVLDDEPWWGPDRFGDDVALGVRTPIGLDLNLRDVPVQIFGDVALDTYIVPYTTVDLGAAIGARYYF